MAERLANDPSAYLRSAKDSPIDWYPWSDEAFEAARQQDRPILLDIGAIWCHWCHVMDHGTYEDPDVIQRLADHYVCIKVDRDARPDVDARYQQAIASLAGQGGWPLTGFLDHDGRPFYGGTYFAPQDAHGRPGFVNVLDEIARIWREERDKVDHTAGHVQDALERYHATSSEGMAAQDTTPTIPQELLDKVPQMLVAQHDARYGGFGERPKFPHIEAIRLALDHHAQTNDEATRDVARRTLEKMAAGGIHDHVEGGFHRYSVDAHWTVPHFEKMAYDNAGLLAAYAHGANLLGRDDWASVARGIVAWTDRYSPDDGYLSSQDADIGPEDDGDHFTWTLEEVGAALAAHIENAGEETLDRLPTKDAPELTAFARQRFGIEERGDMHHDHARNVLEHEVPLETLADERGWTIEDAQRAEAFVLDALAAVRDQRPRPYVDTTAYTDQSMMYASAYLEAGALLDEPTWAARALGVIDTLRERAWVPSVGWRHLATEGAGDEDPFIGTLDDQAWAGLALVDAYRFGGRSDLLELATETADVMLTRWSDDGAAMLRDTPADRARGSSPNALLDLPIRPWLDQGQTGGNAIAARFLLRLGRTTGRDDLVARARAMLAERAEDVPRHGVFAGSWLRTASELLDEPPIVTVMGWQDEPDAQELLRAVRREPRSGVITHLAEPGRSHAWVPEAVRGVLDNEDLIKDGAVVLVCRGQTCDAPTRDLDAIPLMVRSSATLTGAP